MIRDMEFCGWRVREARGEMSAKELGSKLTARLSYRISHTAIYKWEHGAIPNGHNLVALCEVLDKDPNHFFEWSER